ncbi:unnamed protein product, partial [Lampetra planeri]
MPTSAGQRFKPSRYIPVSTAATLLVGSTTLFFVFTHSLTHSHPGSSACRHRQLKILCV